MSVIFSIAAGLLAAAAGVLLGALVLDVLLVLLQKAIQPAESDGKYPKRELIRRAALGVSVGNAYHRRPSTPVHH